MAGYVLPAEAWAEFSDAWDRALKRAPAIRYLKMAEAQNLRGEFRHWSVEKKDKKLKQLARVIRKFDPASFEFSVSRSAFDKIYRPVAPYGLQRPHFACVFGIVSMVTNFVGSTRLPGVRVEFVFDRQDGVSTDMKMFFEYMSENLPDFQRDLIKSDPSFEDDTEFLPLQAADMLAWHLRREHEDGTIISTPVMELLRGEMHFMTRLEPNLLAKWARHHGELPAAPMTKTGWKKALKEAQVLKDTGFKPPHGDVKEIALAQLLHLKKLAEG